MGKFEFVKLSRIEILDWIREIWKEFIKNILRVLSLVNGWLFIIFISKEDRNTVDEHL